MNSKWPLLSLAVLFAWLVPQVPAQDEEQPKKPKSEKGFRVFKSKDGKSLKARVVSRIDDARYTVETLEGQTFTLNVENLSRVDQTFLELWEPGAILDLEGADLKDVLEEMGYGAAELTTAGNRLFVMARVDDRELKFVLDQGRNFSTLDPETARELGLELAQGGVSLRDAAGKVERSQQGSVKQLSVAQISFGSQLFQVIDMARLAGGTLPKDTAGALGADVLKRLNALVDHGGQFLFVRESE